MKVSELHNYPNLEVLHKIISGKRLKVVSPFYSAASLDKINPNKIKKMTFITRLPIQYQIPPVYIDNDPQPLMDLMEKMGKQLKVFALPSLHAKLYINENTTWIGSPNFTINGFSGKQELLLEFDSAKRKWLNVFRAYRGDSVNVTPDDLKKLLRWTTLGLTVTRGSHYVVGKSSKEIKQTPLTFEDFIDWLAEPDQPHPDLRERIRGQIGGKNNMSGHVPPAFNGTMAFLRLKKEYIPILESANDGLIPENVLDDLASFIKKYGDQYRGVRGGYWRNYLSDRLGGNQASGGAGDVVVKRCLALIPAFLKARRLDIE